MDPMCHGSKKLRNSALRCQCQHFRGTICLHILTRSWRPHLSLQNWYMSTQLQSITMSLSPVLIPLGLIKIGGFLHCNLGASSFADGATSTFYLSDGLTLSKLHNWDHKYEVPLGKICFNWKHPDVFSLKYSKSKFSQNTTNLLSIKVTSLRYCRFK